MDEYGYVVKQTYLYLRLSLVGTIVAIFLAVAFTPKQFLPDGQMVLRSISHYYYSPARIVFVGAVCAAALALLTLAGKGIQSYLLDIAALLAPLIVLIPTPVKLNEVAAFDPQCATPDADCVPKGDFEYARLGFEVWFWMALLVILIGIGLAAIRAYRARKELGEKVPPLFWGALAVASVIWAFFGWTGFRELDWFHSKAHFVAAGAFFLIVSVVACIEAVLQRRRRYRFADKSRERKLATRYSRTYGAIGLLLFVNNVLAGIIIYVQIARNPDFAPIGIFVVEAIGLLLFAAFFAVQTIDKWDDGDGWGPLPPKQNQQEREQTVNAA